MEMSVANSLVLKCVLAPGFRRWPIGGLVHEQALERGSGLGAAHGAHAQFEHGELRHEDRDQQEETSHERSGAPGSAGPPTAARDASARPRRRPRVGAGPGLERRGEHRIIPGRGDP